MKSLVVAIGLTGLSVSTVMGAPSFILCHAPEKESIVLELDAHLFEDITLSCVAGGEFVYDMTPCAPDGGYGLSAPTGSAALVEVVYRWQDYGDHMGGVTAFSASPSAYRFEGGFMYDSYETAWTLEVSRLTGAATLSIVDEDGPFEPGEVGYSCSAVDRKF